jgi:Bacterial Ig-like domain (group 3)
VKSLSSATGTVTFPVGGHTYTVKLVNGKASFKYTWHAPGNYKVTAAYDGSSTHLASKETDSVKVAS